jgi:hypothetical protein
MVNWPPPLALRVLLAMKTVGFAFVRRHVWIVVFGVQFVVGLVVLFRLFVVVLRRNILLRGSVWLCHSGSAPWILWWLASRGRITNASVR